MGLPFFRGGRFFFFLAWLPALSPHSTTRTIYRLKGGGGGTLLAGGIRGGGARQKKKKKIGLPFFRESRFFFLAWLPAPSLQIIKRTLSSRNIFSEFKPSEYKPKRHYYTTSDSQHKIQ